MPSSKNHKWFDQMTRDDQEEYVRMHPHTDMIPNASRDPAQYHIKDREKSRVLALKQKINDSRKKFTDTSLTNRYEGLPSSANDLVRHLKSTSNPKAQDLLKNLKKSWEDVSRESKGKVSNPELLKIWSARLNRDHAQDINEMKSFLEKDNSPSASHAIKSISGILGSDIYKGKRSHMAQIMLELTKVSSQI